MLLRSTLIYAPAILLTRISALLLLVIATRLIDQTEYGFLTLVVTVGEMTDVAVTNWLRIGLLRLGGKGEISSGSLWLAAKVLFVTTALSVLISVAASGIVAPERWIDFALAVSAYLVAGAIGRFALTILQMQQRHGTYSLLEFLRAMLQLVLPVLAVTVSHSFLALSIASSLGMLLAGSVALTIALRHVVSGPARFTYGALFALGLPLIGLAILGFGLNSAERVLLKIYYDASAVAVFAAAYALARQPIDTIANAINMGGFPEMVSRFDRDGPDAAAAFLSHQLALMARLSLPVAALLVALAHEITSLFLPANYHGAVDALFPIIAVSVLATNVGSFVFENVIHAHKKPILLVFSMAPGSAATIILSLLLIPPYAEIGAALALCGGALANLAGIIVISRRLTVVPIPWTELATSAAIALAVGVAAVLITTALGGFPAYARLFAGGAVGGAVFLTLTSLLHPQETRAFARTVRLRLGMA